MERDAPGDIQKVFIPLVRSKQKETIPSQLVDDLRDEREMSNQNVPIVGPAARDHLFIQTHPRLAGYQLFSRISKLPGWENWEALSPNQHRCQMHILWGMSTKETLEAVEKIRAVRFPHLTELTILCSYGEQLILLAEEYEFTLADRFRNCWQLGLPGVPPKELIGLLRIAEETLRFVRTEHGLHHLAVQPETFVWRQGGVRMSGIGLMQWLWLPQRRGLDALPHRYAAPELRHGRYTAQSDQYSLAVIYAQMRMGTHPFRHIDRITGQIQPDLRRLSTAEQEVLNRALNSDVHLRYSCISEMIEALSDAVENCVSMSPPPTHLFEKANSLPFVPVRRHPDDGVELVMTTDAAPLCRELQSLTLGSMQPHRSNELYFYLEPGVCLKHYCITSVHHDHIAELLKYFPGHWFISSIEKSNRTIRFAVVEADPCRGFRSRVSETLLVEIEEHASRRISNDHRELEISIRPESGSLSHKRLLLEQTAPRFLYRLRDFLGVLADMRHQHRQECSQPIQVLLAYDHLQLIYTVECIGKDISAHGIGFYSPYWLPSPKVYLHLPWLSQFKDVAVRATIVRSLPRNTGWYEMGATFEQSALRTVD